MMVCDERVAWAERKKRNFQKRFLGKTADLKRGCGGKAEKIFLNYADLFIKL